MKNLSKTTYYFGLLLLLLFFGCDDSINIVDIDNRIIPDSNVSYADHIVPVFQAKCFACHGNGRTDGGLDLSIHTRFVDGRIVVPGDTSTSILIWRVEGNRSFDPMPPLGTAYPLTPNQIKGLKTWIQDGAKNN